MNVNISNYFVFNGINSRDYGIRITGRRIYGGPLRAETPAQIPGKNGDVIMDDGRWNNRQEVYDCSISSGMAEKLDSFRAAIMAEPGYHRLEDSYHPEEFYLARISQAIEPTAYMQLRGATFTITFDRKPQRFLRSGETELESQATLQIYNPTLYDAKPIITMNCGSGNTVKFLNVGALSNDNRTAVYPYPVVEAALSASDFQTALATGLQVIFDCEIGEAYGYYSVGGAQTVLNLNKAITLAANGLPHFPGGQTTPVSFSGDSYKVMPRWYTL